MQFNIHGIIDTNKCYVGRHEVPKMTADRHYDEELVESDLQFRKAKAMWDKIAICRDPDMGRWLYFQMAIDPDMI
jgi:hypothetical protein